jgi:hypothetical protein
MAAQITERYTVFKNPIGVKDVDNRSYIELTHKISRRRRLVVMVFPDHMSVDYVRTIRQKVGRFRKKRKMVNSYDRKSKTVVMSERIPLSDPDVLEKIGGFVDRAYDFRVST